MRKFNSGIYCWAFFSFGIVSGPSNEQVDSIINLGQKSLNENRYQRLRGKVSQIKQELLRPHLEHFQRTQLELAKNHFETTVNIFERNIEVEVTHRHI